MPKQIMLDQLQLTFQAPDNLKKTESAAIWAVLSRRGFRQQLRDSIRRVMRRHESLRRVRWTLR